MELHPARLEGPGELTHAEMGADAHGVVIGNEAVFTRAPREAERDRSARDADGVARDARTGWPGGSSRSARTGLTLRDDWDRAASGLKARARDWKLDVNPGRIDFERTFETAWLTRLAVANERRACTESYLSRRHGSIGVRDAMLALRQHGSPTCRVSSRASRRSVPLPPSLVERSRTSSGRVPSGFPHFTLPIIFQRGERAT